MTRVMVLCHLCRNEFPAALKGWPLCKRCLRPICEGCEGECKAKRVVSDLKRKRVKIKRRKRRVSKM